jgi:hypothetical protein
MITIENKVVLHGAVMDIESEEGTGTKIKITFTTP